MSLLPVIPPHIEKFCDDLRAELATPRGEGLLLPSFALMEGCEVKVGGEWVRFDGLDGDAMLLSSSSAGFSYTPSSGETFAWRCAV